MKNLVYPAIFHKEGTGYWVEFPDIPGCMTEGDTLDEAFLMAGDALDVWFFNGDEENPVASKISDIKVGDDDIVMLVSPKPYQSEQAKRYEMEQIIEKSLKEKNFNKNQVAIILGVDRAYISRIASGQREPSKEMAKRIGLLLGFDWKLFFKNEVLV